MGRIGKTFTVAVYNASENLYSKRPGIAAHSPTFKTYQFRILHNFSLNFTTSEIRKRRGKSNRQRSQMAYDG